MDWTLPAVGVDVGVWFGFDFGLHVEELGFVGEAQFFHEDGDFPGVGTLLVGPEGDWLRHDDDDANC